MGAVEDLLTKGPASSGSSSSGSSGSKKYIGVDDDYAYAVQPRPYSGGPTSPRQAERRSGYVRPPQYQTGADAEPISYSPEQIARLQTGLATAGLIGPETRYRLGVYDDATRSAYNELLGYANQNGYNRETALSELIANPALTEKQRQESGMAGGQSPTFQTAINTYRQSDPAGVRQTVEAAFQQALGRNPTKEESEKFVSGFLGSERANQSQQFAVADEERGADRDRAMAGASGQGSESDQLWAAVNQMIAESPYADRVKPGARTRSYEDQVKKYEAYKNGTGPLAAKPGTSKHGDGRANDIQGINSDPAIRKWFHENAARYGLSFPLYDPSKPRDKNEAWHVELKGGHSTGDGHNHGGGGGGTPVSRDVVDQNMDAGARAIEFARNSDPVETQAVGIGKQFQSFLSIIGRGVS